MRLKLLPILLALISIPLSVSATEETPVSKDTSLVTEQEYKKILYTKFKKGKGYSTPKSDRVIKYSLLEKYCSYAGFNVGFASYDVNNKWIEPIVRINDAYIKNFNFKVHGGYFIKDDVALGVSFNYGIYNTKFDVTADILDLLIGAKDYSTSNAGYNYRGAFQIKNFIPLNKSQRIFLTNVTSFWYGYNYYLGKNSYNNGEKETKSVQRTHSLGAGISPGIMYFMSRGFAFEFNFNPISIYYKDSYITNNEIENGSSRSYGLNFEFVPFNIELGFSYYFGLDYVKHAKMVEL